MKHLYLFGRNIVQSSSLRNKNSSAADLLNSEVTGNFGVIQDSTTLSKFFGKMNSLNTRITDKSELSVTSNYKKSAKDFLFAERRWVEIFRPNRYYVKHETIHGEVLITFFLGQTKEYSLLRQTIKVEAFLHTVKSLQTKQHKTNQRHRNLMQTSWFQANFVIFLWSHSEWVMVTRSEHAYR